MYILSSLYCKCIQHYRQVQLLRHVPHESAYVCKYLHIYIYIYIYIYYPQHIASVYNIIGKHDPCIMFLMKV